MIDWVIILYLFMAGVHLVCVLGSLYGLWLIYKFIRKVKNSIRAVLSALSDGDVIAAKELINDFLGGLSWLVRKI